MFEYIVESLDFSAVFGYHESDFKKTRKDLRREDHESEVGGGGGWRGEEDDHGFSTP